MDADEPLASFSTIAVDDVRLPDLDVYRHLKDRHLKCREGLFVAEGSEVVRRLLRSRFAVHSLLVTPEKLARLRDDVPAQVPVYVASVAQMEQVAGFAIHRGAVACGHRQPRRSLDAVLAEVVDPRLVVVLEGVCDAQNVGLMVRNARHSGRIWSSPADVAIRSIGGRFGWSMGNVFRVPICESEYVLGDLRALRDRYGMTLVAGGAIRRSHLAAPGRQAAACGVAVRLRGCRAITGCSGNLRPAGDSARPSGERLGERRGCGGASSCTHSRRDDTRRHCGGTIC